MKELPKTTTMFVLDQEQETSVALHQVNLINGKFTASEASDILNSLIDKKINFHKIQRLGLTEGNHHDDCPYDNSRINELIEEKEQMKKVLLNSLKNGKKLILEGQISIKVIE